MVFWQFGRRLFARLKLKTAYIVAALAAAVYFGLLAYKPSQFVNLDDPVIWWLNRGEAAALLFVGLTLLDRLAIVPLLTRGGRVPMARFVHQISNILLALFAIVIFGSIAFDWNIDKFLAGSAVVSIVLGLALQETLGNFFSGLVMQASPPFAIGDWIVCGEHEGRVVDMTWRAVTLHTDDDNFILIPNATVAKADIVNYHAPSTATARLIKVGLEYDLPPMAAMDVLKAAALETAGVQASPEPRVHLLEYGDSAVVYGVKFWIDNPQRHDEIEHGVRVSAWYRLKEKGYNIPFPMRTVEHINIDKKNARAAAAAVTRRADVFESAPVLQPLSREQKEHLAAIANDVFLAPGQVLFRQNDPGDSFYVISKGTAEVLVSADGQPEKVIATLGSGEFFGEMSALTGQPRTATIRAASAFECIQIEKRDLMEIFRGDSTIMEKLSEVVAQRNAHRQEASQGAANASAPEAVRTQQKTLLGRMKHFFRIGGE
jgi:small-conductance mechanosensitive channel/CRP-like cAMP-binding protein